MTFGSAGFSFGSPSFPSFLPSSSPVKVAAAPRYFTSSFREAGEIEPEEKVTAAGGSGGGGFWDKFLNAIVLPGAAAATSLGLERLRQDWNVAPFYRGAREFDYYDPSMQSARQVSTFGLGALAQYIPLALLIFGGAYSIKIARGK